MNIGRVIAAAALTVAADRLRPRIWRSGRPGQQSGAAAVPAQVTSEGAQYADTVPKSTSCAAAWPPAVTQYQELDAVA